MNIATLLAQPGRSWDAVPGAAEDAIRRLVSLSPVRLPDELLDLLRFSDGGEGELALAPCWFVLDSVAEIVRGLQDPVEREEYPGFVFFGGNGGLERIALDAREGAEPWPVVMIDPIAGAGSAERIASSMADFVDAIGLVLPDDDPADAS
jgi:hypothetical protein